LREIKLLRKLTEMESNIFTTPIIDIIIPFNSMQTIDNLKNDQYE